MRKADDKRALWRDIRELKRDRILQEAAVLIYERGYSQTSVEAIAERLGATKPFVYYHFDTKIDILVEICRSGTSDALVSVGKSAEAETDPAIALRKFVRAFCEAALRNHRFVAIYYREEASLPADVALEIQGMRRQIERRLCDMLARGKEAGIFDFQDLRLTARTILGMASFAFAWYRHDREAELFRIVDQMEQLALKVVALPCR
ncbi:TetR/AcrR family transcriptional regulator [Bosea sp. (in: a-proteobacteria)]|uniref:TetR/AcrR family transcriptional regulator n=1 Tax=Bosea sp. (in: a-proteobacteria) TaxID=1871050 RepID=UPI003B3A99BB